MCQVAGAKIIPDFCMRNSTLVTSIKERNPVRIWRDWWNFMLDMLTAKWL